MAKQLAQNMKAYHAGQTIFKQGQPGNQAFIIKQGAVDLYITVRNQKIVLTRLHAGEIFGEMAVISQSPRSASAEAVDFTQVLVLHAEAVKGLLSKSPAPVQHLMKVLIRRLQNADRNIKEKSTHNPFLSISRMLHMLEQLRLNAGGRRGEEFGDPARGWNYEELSQRIRDVVLVSQLDIDNTLKKLHKLGLIDISGENQGRKVAFRDKYVRIPDPAGFLDSVDAVFQEMPQSGPYFFSELDTLSISDFAKLVNTTPQVVYKKMANMEVPENIFSINRSLAKEWAETQDEDFFKKVIKKRLKPEEMSGAADIIHVDNATLKEAFQRLGYYKLSVIYAVSPEDAQQKVLRNLAPKMAKIVQEEASKREFLDEDEAEDIQEELIDIIKELKAPPK